jgi:hypothetical protein
MNWKRGKNKMILKVSEKTNVNGWRRQLVIDLENKTVKKGAFQFSTTGDINQLTHKQYLQFIEYFKNNDFEIVEG